ncbi:MAG: MBL fold metallo-hydrolase [Deltaproteobacteria bacterium]|nr:MAG: MBL fold metallo-hydrolase [Deltaproteobacteria bacterium]TMQ20628.1 MAG: MBL fold metallo-hydrolase [Deltaproteobacteria bacterium]
MLFRQLFDPDTSTYTYLLADDATREAILIDPVLDQIERDIGLIGDLGLRLRYALDTHVHADHVTALGSLRERLGARTVMSERAGVGCADILVKDGDILRFGSCGVEVRETPGHTDGCISYVTLDRAMAFTGDALLIRGCGRTDFQGGDPAELYRSIHDKLFTLPGTTLIYPAHDYKGRTASSVDEERRLNPRLGGTRTAADLVAIMQALSLAYPKNMDVALPRNVHCGMAITTGEPAPGKRWAPVEVSPGGIPEVAPEWVAAHGTEVRLIDVREPDELTGELGHISGIEPLPLDQLPGPLAAAPRDRELVFVCRSGGRSGKAALLAAGLGFERVASMRGGMRAWHERRYPVAR